MAAHKLWRSARVRPLLNSRVPRAATFLGRPGNHRTLAARSTADEKIEEIQDLFATAKDEFEIASEETEKKTVYAADDRAAAQEELTKLKSAFADAVKGEGGDEIQRRIGGRLRELERAVEHLEEKAMED